MKLQASQLTVSHALCAVLLKYKEFAMNFMYDMKKKLLLTVIIFGIPLTLNFSSVKYQSDKTNFH